MENRLSRIFITGHLFTTIIPKQTQFYSSVFDVIVTEALHPLVLRKLNSLLTLLTDGFTSLTPTW